MNGSSARSARATCARRERVRLREHHHEWLASKRVDLHLGNLDGRAKETDVEGAVDEAGNLAGRQQLPGGPARDPEARVRSKRLMLGSSSYVADPVKPIVTLSHPPVADQLCLVASSVDLARIDRARSRYCSPAGVRSTLRVERSSS